MHLHRLEGAWMDHPFWRTRFTLSDEADLQALRASAVKEAWINTALGRDVDAAMMVPVAPVVVVSKAPKEVVPASPVAAPAKVAFDEELQNAQVLCQRSRQAVASMFAELRMGRAIDAQQCLPLVQEITDSVGRHPGALVSLARLKTSDDYTYMHSMAVCALMVALGRQLGLDDAACHEAGLAGLLHDMGKAFMPLEILNKPGKLTDAEFAVMRSHSERGHALLLASQGVPAGALDVCLHHHEKMDGSGYPHRLAGEQITLLARMGAVCDVYDAVTSNRPYKEGWDPAHAIASMAGWKGHFDPPVFAAFVQSLGIYPTGSLVRLASGKLAVVVEQNATAITMPVVKVFFSTKAKLPLPVQRLDLSASNERILGRESREGWNTAQIEALWSAQA